MKSYITFLFNSLIKRVSFYITTLLYFFMEILILFIVPYILNTPLTYIYLLTWFWSMLVVVGAIMTVVVTTNLFRSSIDDGSELLILSKPISRSKILYSKIIVLFSVGILISAGSFLIGLFTSISESNQDYFWLISAGLFVGTLITFLLFSSISVVLSIYFKKIMTIIGVVGVNTLLLLYLFVSSVTLTSPSTYFDNRDISFDKVNVLEKQRVKVDNKEVFKTFDGVIGLYKNKPINAETTVQNGSLLLDQNSDPRLFLSEFYKKAVKNTNAKAMTITNLMYQWGSLYNLISEEYLSRNWDQFLYLLNENSSAVNFSINPSPQNLFINSTPEALDDKYFIFKIKGFENDPTAVESFTISKQIESLISPIFSKWLHSEYVEDSSNITLRTLPNIFLNFELPSVTNKNKLKVKINVDWKATKEINFDLTNPAWKTEFETNFLQPLIKLNDTINNHLLPLLTYLNIPINESWLKSTIMASLFWKQLSNVSSTNTQNITYQDFNSLNEFKKAEIVNKFYSDVNKLDMLLFKYLQSESNTTIPIYNISNNVSTPNEIALNLLGVSTKMDKENPLIVSLLNPNQLTNLINNSSTPDQIRSAFKKNFGLVQNSYQLINIKNLETVSDFKPELFLSYDSMAGGWTAFSLILSAFSIALYSKKDFR